MFSKKYPIEIRQGGLGERMATLPRRKLRSSEPAATPDSDGEDSFHDVAALESDDVFKMDFERADPRVFYLFARADREKEDLYKSLMDAHHFLTDTVLDVARREGAITEGIDRFVLLQQIPFNVFIWIQGCQGQRDGSRTQNQVQRLHG